LIHFYKSFRYCINSYRKPRTPVSTKKKDGCFEDQSVHDLRVGKYPFRGQQ